AGARDLGRGGRQHPAAAARDDLVAVEAEAAGQAERAGGPPLVRAAEGLGRVLDHREAVLGRDRHERVEVNRVAEEVDRQERRDALAADAVPEARGRALALAREE